MGAAFTITKLDFSDDQKADIKSTWETLYSGNKFQLGVELMANLFKAHPDYQDLFPSLKGIPDVAGSNELRGHAIRVITGINNFVDALDEEEEVMREMLHNMARSHKPRKLTKTHFNEFAPILLETFEKKVDMSSKARDAWIALYYSIVDNLFAEMAKLD
uniref:Hemoglobin n=1 Tax=Ophiactis simplex TaxID=533354 RepID=W6FSH9_9ECHI|nr:hemoglobin [Ophiactis simplex]AHN50407.1 hemoglobin [Ophiactis simplex]